MPIKPPPRTATAAQAQSESLYFDFGAAFAGSADSSLGLLGGGLGGPVATNGSPSARAAGNITLSGLQSMMAQISTVSGNYGNYQVGLDWSTTAASQGVYTVTYPVLPTSYPVVPESAWSQLYQMQFQMNAITGSMNVMGYTPETPEQRIAREEADVKRRAARSAAEKRAEIDDRVYRIHKRGHSQNVELIVKGKAVAKYCVHPENAHQTPVQDTMISQLLMLHSDEGRFLKTANKTILYG